MTYYAFMLFGQPVTESARMAFRRPQAAAFYTPRLPQTGFFTHIYPFMNVMAPMRSHSAMIPRYPADAQPGTVRVRDPRRTDIRQQLPAQVVEQPPMPPMPGPTAGFFGAPAWGPQRLMRTGGWPGIPSSGRNIRAGVGGAGALIRRLTPYGFPNQNVPAGTYSVG